jgi:hypothetical protein
MCRAAFERALARAEGGAPEAAAGTWRRMAECLAPVIGVRGVDAMFRHSLHLARLEDSDPAAAQAASLTLLMTFTGLLESMIGTALMERLLAPVWGLTAPAPGAGRVMSSHPAGIGRS